MPGEFRGHQPDQNEPKKETREEIEKQLKALKPRILSVCYKYLAQPAYRNDIQDVVQTAMMKAYKNWDTFNYKSSRKTWVTVITINCCIDQIRRTNRKIKNLGNVDAGENLTIGNLNKKDSERFVENTRDQLDYEKLISDKNIAKVMFSVLSEEEQEIVQMQIRDGMSINEISERTGITNNTVKSKLFRARQKMMGAYYRQQRP